MKSLFILLCLLLPDCLFAAELTPEQQRKVRHTVNQYCTLLSDFAKSESYVGNMPIMLNLMSDDHTRIFDDLKTDTLVYITTYLTNIVSDFNHSLSISFENINNIEIIGFERPNFEKSNKKVYAQMEIMKTIRGNGLNKTIKNAFVVNLEDYKIFGIKNSNGAFFDDADPYLLWDRGLDFYNKKKYNEALVWFEKSANKGYVEAQYYCGIMYIKGEGCKQFKRKERDKRGICWMQKASQNGIHEARQDLDRLGVWEEINCN
jgi:hypothetical protein